MQLWCHCLEQPQYRAAPHQGLILTRADAILPRILRNAVKTHPRKIQSSLKHKTKCQQETVTEVTDQYPNHCCYPCVLSWPPCSGLCYSLAPRWPKLLRGGGSGCPWLQGSILASAAPNVCGEMEGNEHPAENNPMCCKKETVWPLDFTTAAKVQPSPVASSMAFHQHQKLGILLMVVQCLIPLVTPQKMKYLHLLQQYLYKREDTD